jgi:protein SCO1/2
VRKAFPDLPIDRRTWLLAASLAAAGVARAQAPAGAPPPGSSAAPLPNRRGRNSHLPFGPVNPPDPVPAWRVVGHDGRAVDLRSRLTGRVTLLQLMFTGCSATCPIQGAVFAGVAPKLPEGAQLLSLSIDALNDDAKALAAWLKRHGAQGRWTAAVPRVQDVDAVFEFFSGQARGPDPHTANVYVIDRQARLIFKTPEMPSSEELVTLLGQAVKRA